MLLPTAFLSHARSGGGLRLAPHALQATSLNQSFTCLAALDELSVHNPADALSASCPSNCTIDSLIVPMETD